MKPEDVTVLLSAASAGDTQALKSLVPIVYNELRRRAGAMMRSERAGHTLDPTALVHEVFVVLARQQNVDWRGRAHFFAVASQLMRRILVDHARARLAGKRGGASERVTVHGDLSVSIGEEADVLAVDDALQALAKVHPEHAEIVAMRFFGGLSVEEVAAVLGRPKRTVEKEWTFIRAWLRRELEAR